MPICTWIRWEKPPSFNIEDATPQGWRGIGGSGVKNALTIRMQTIQSYLLEVAYPDVKPTDGWALHRVFCLKEINTTRGDNQYLCF
jgi:endoglucanase